MNVKELNSRDEFNKTIENGVSLIDFNAKWCGPCKALAPIIKDLAGKFDSKAIIGEMDVDSNSDIANTFGVQSIPTIIIFKNGTEVKRLIGLQSEVAISKELNKAIN